MTRLELDISGGQMHINRDEKESLVYLANSLINDNNHIKLKGLKKEETY